MLVIISDLHLTDGTSGTTVGEHAFKIFRNKLGDLAYEASWRRDGKYQPIETLNILLLGDVLDIIRSSSWLTAPNGLRPWDDYSDDAYASMVKKINENILDHNKKSLDVLKSVSQGNRITLPPATSEGLPADVAHHYDAQDRIPVDVNIYYMVGNHDWFYHLRGAKYNEIRQSVIDAMGLTQDSSQPFPHDPAESDELMRIFRDHKVFARHGDIFDPFNYEGDRDGSSLGDAIVVDLLNKFPDAVEHKFKGQLPDTVIRNIKEIDNVRPLPLIPVWIDVLLDNASIPKQLRKDIKKVWNEMADEFLELPFVRERDRPWRMDEVDMLELGLKFTEHLSFDTIAKILAKIYKNSDPTDSYKEKAKSEHTLISKQADHIIYGHTHYPEIVPMDVFTNEQGILSNQLYFNSGTWRQIFRRTYASRGIKFIGYKVMSILSFYKEDERKGRGFEVWNGSLE